LACGEKCNAFFILAASLADPELFICNEYIFAVLSAFSPPPAEAGIHRAARPVFPLNHLRSPQHGSCACARDDGEGSAQ
jgi:hypothetical protein